MLVLACPYQLTLEFGVAVHPLEHAGRLPHEMSTRPAVALTLVRRVISSIFLDFCSDCLGRLQPLITTPESPQILVALCENEAVGGIYILT